MADLNRMKAALAAELAALGDATDAEIRGHITDLILSESRRHYISMDERTRLAGELFAAVRRLDVLQDYIDDPDVTEIMVNGPETIFIEKNGRIEKSPKRFSSEERLLDVIRRIVGRVNRAVNEKSPIADARLPDGSRVNAVLPPASIGGPILTIRRFPREPIGMADLLKYGTLTAEAAEFLANLVRAGYSILIGGGTSAGKTTLLNVLAGCIPPRERLITIEDNAELQIRGIENLVRLEARQANMEENAEITIRDLVKSSLRMRPDRIIVGEVRGAEAVDFLQAINTGHEGSLSSIHANSCADMVPRLETMVLMAFPLPIPAIRRQIASGVDILVHLSRVRGGARRITEIAETDGCEGEEVRLRTLFSYDEDRDILVPREPLKHTRKLKRLEEKHEPARL